MSLGYDILPAITWLWANTNIRLLHDARTSWCSKLGGLRNLTTTSTTLSCSTVTSMTRHLHCVVTKSPWQSCRQHDLAAPSPAWLDIYIVPWPSRPGSAITSMTRQHRRQPDSVSTSHRSQVTPATSVPAWLSSTVARMTWHLHRIVAKIALQCRL
jgi:hypothetical protein